MENPVYKLEKVMRAPKEEDMQDFEGPLDVILFLLSKHKVEIADISISQILEQYLVWLEQRQNLDLEVASEFITMASHLMFIKTRMLLSLEDADAQSEMDELIQSLEARQRGEHYARIQAMVTELEPLASFGYDTFTRYPQPMEPDKQYTYSHVPGELVLAMVEIQNRAQRALPPPKEAFEKLVGYEPYPVEGKALHILERLQQSGVMKFFSLFWGSRSRSEVVATFLAVLELCRNRAIHLVEQDGVVHLGADPQDDLMEKEGVS